MRNGLGGATLGKRCLGCCCAGFIHGHQKAAGLVELSLVGLGSLPLPPLLLLLLALFVLSLAMLLPL